MTKLKRKLPSTGYRYITTFEDKRHTNIYEYYRIRVSYYDDNFIYTKIFKKTEHTLEQVVEFRNHICKLLNKKI